MQILIACAKIMTGSAPAGVPLLTEPEFKAQATEHAHQIAQYSVEELQNMLGVNHEIAAENWRRYQQFFTDEDRVPAVFAYDGMVFQKLAPETFSEAELRYANQHLLIGSFLYGLLRPLDLVHRYRLEGNVELPHNGGNTMFGYWKPILTDWFINRVKADDGILVNLASNEFKDLFDWKRVKKELTIVTPDFKVMKDGKPRTIVIYAKMCRGAMTRWILKNRITDVADLKQFQYEGFSHTDDYKFIMQ